MTLTSVVMIKVPDQYKKKSQGMVRLRSGRIATNECVIHVPYFVLWR